MAVAACSSDPRFNPVSAGELKNLEYEISVLSVPKRITDWKKIELGKHGVIISDGIRSGVFLPQVATETGWTLEEFLAHLCAEKAGLGANCYKSANVEINIFTATIIK
jgi:AmmeMemoRadiSam system protein A